jgi:hypothetical protein
VETGFAVTVAGSGGFENGVRCGRLKHDVKANLTSLPGHESGKFNLPLYKIKTSLMRVTGVGASPTLICGVFFWPLPTSAKMLECAVVRVYTVGNCVCNSINSAGQCPSVRTIASISSS